MSHLIQNTFFCFLITILLPTEPALCRGDSVYLVGLSRSLQATSRKSIVTNPSAVLKSGSSDVPRYRATNLEVIELDTGMLEHKGPAHYLWC